MYGVGKCHGCCWHFRGSSVREMMGFREHVRCTEAVESLEINLERTTVAFDSMKSGNNL